MSFIKQIIIKIRNKLKGWRQQNSVSGLTGLNTIVLKGCSIDANTRIGSECFINTNTIITKAEIGSYCSIGSNVVIGPGEHDLSKISTSGRFYNDAYSELTKKSCIIGNDVWIGTYAIVLRGVRVGDGAVIGANSVVTRDVPDFAVVAGTPAKVLKYRFSKEMQQTIKSSSWWELNLKESKEMIKKLDKECIQK